MKSIPFNVPSTVGKEFEYMKDAVNVGHLAGGGIYTKLCQDIISRITDGKHALLTHSCTAALEMAAILCNLKPGDEVIMPSWTFVSTANAVVLRGAIPVFIDIFEDTLCLNTEQVRAAVTPRTRAIFAVHYAGVIADMKTLRDISNEHGLLLVEDAAQALGSSFDGEPAGSQGDMAAFSFHQTKNVISGEGGALVLNNSELFRRAEILREKGTDRCRYINGEVDKYKWLDIGSSFLPGELVASFLYAQLIEEDKVRKQRLKYWNHYQAELSKLSIGNSVLLPYIPKNCEHNGHMYHLRFKSQKYRTSFVNRLGDKGISSQPHYVPLHDSPAGLKFGRTFSDMRNTNRLAECIVRLPLFFDLGIENCERVVQAVRETL